MANKKYGTPFAGDQKALETALYWKWFPGQPPSLKPEDYDGVLEQIKGLYSATSPAPTRAPTKPAPPAPPGKTWAPTAAPTNKPEPKSSFPVVPVVIGVVVVALIGLGVAFFIVNQTVDDI